MAAVIFLFFLFCAGAVVDLFAVPQKFWKLRCFLGRLETAADELFSSTASRARTNAADHLFNTTPTACCSSSSTAKAGGHALVGGGAAGLKIVLRLIFGALGHRVYGDARGARLCTRGEREEEEVCVCVCEY